MKFAALLLLTGSLFAQAPTTPKPAPLPKICGDDGRQCLAFAPISSPVAEWNAQVKDGTYIATFTDPGNHWRCYVVGMVGENSLHGIQAFTVTCVDTTASGNIPVSQPVTTGGAK